MDITVTPVNDAPVATGETDTTPEDTTLTVLDGSPEDLLQNDTDVDTGDVLTITQYVVGTTTYPAGTTAALTEGDLTINADGSYTFVPASNFNGTVPTATYTVSDGNGGTDTADLDITVTPVNDPPVADNDTAITLSDTNVNILASTGDTDLDGTINLSSIDLDPTTPLINDITFTVAGEGTYTANSDGTVTFDPLPTFSGIATAVNYTIEDNDGAESNIATLIVTVGACVDNPILDCDGDGVTNGDELAPPSGETPTNPEDPCSYNVADITVAITSTNDCDGDGVIDATEIANGTNPKDPCSYNIADITVAITSTSDCDGDGVIDATEIVNGTNPKDSCSYNIADITVAITSTNDCDGDGVIDATEVANGTNPKDPCSYNVVDITLAIISTNDCDGDGVTDATEVANGTDPKDPCSYNRADITLPVTATADCTAELKVVKTADYFGKDLDDVISYTITVENTGNVTVTNLVLVDSFMDNQGNVLSLTTPVTFQSSSFDSLAGTLLVGEIGTYTASFKITQQAINASGVSNSVVATGIAPNGDDVIDTSDNGDDFDGNSNDDPTVTQLGCLITFNEFSPNDDGVNETFVIGCIENYPNNKLEVYNRWGNIVYTKRKYNNEFNGISNGRATMNTSEKLPEGTYYYVLDLGDGSKPRVGWLYINR
ncbi:hypothetical protein MFUCSW5_450259 [Mariniflexile fucanivorans]